MYYLRNQVCLFSLLVLGLFLSACYSFQGASIPVETNTYYVDLFQNNALEVVPNLDISFTESLKNKIREQSRLRYNDTEPDIEFSGSITEYKVTFMAPEPGETAAFNQLRMTVMVDYINNKKEEDKWEQRFSFFVDFSNDENLIDIQDDLITALNNQLVEDIFNKAFNNW